MSPLNFFLIMVGLFVFTLTTFHTMDQPSQYEAMRKNAESQKDPVVNNDVWTKQNGQSRQILYGQEF
jgi:hypothetical protein